MQLLVLARATSEFREDTALSKKVAEVSILDPRGHEKEQATDRVAYVSHNHSGGVGETVRTEERGRVLSSYH